MNEHAHVVGTGLECVGRCESAHFCLDAAECVLRSRSRHPAFKHDDLDAGHLESSGEVTEIDGTAEFGETAPGENGLYLVLGHEVVQPPQ